MACKPTTKLINIRATTYTIDLIQQGTRSLVIGIEWSEAILGKCEASKCYHRGTPFPFWVKNKLRMGCNTSSEEWPHVSVFIGFDNCYQFHLAWGPRELQLLQRSRFTSNFLSLPSLLPMPRVGTLVEGNNVAGIWNRKKYSHMYLREY